MIDIEPPSSSFELTGLSKSGLARFLNRARVAVGLVGDVDVLLTSDAEVKRLNKAFRGKNKATDVLSFPAPEEAEDVAGDIAISLETALKQAGEHGHTLRDEVRVLMLHGLLHLDGEDHETDAGEMATRELALRVELGLGSGLIERVVGAASLRGGPKRNAGPSTALRSAQDDKVNRSRSKTKAGR